MPLAISQQRSSFDVWHGSEYISGNCYTEKLLRKFQKAQRKANAAVSIFENIAGLHTLLENFYHMFSKTFRTTGFSRHIFQVLSSALFLTLVLCEPILPLLK